jgi:hypothetical protein
MLLSKFQHLKHYSKTLRESNLICTSLKWEQRLRRIPEEMSPKWNKLALHTIQEQLQMLQLYP